MIRAAESDEVCLCWSPRRGQRRKCAFFFFSSVRVCIRRLSDTESQKSEGEKHGLESEPHT